MSPTGKEKRSKARLALDMPVDLKRLDVFEVASIGDLSPQGVFIATQQQYPPGTEIELQLTFPPANTGSATPGADATVTIKGEVVWAGDKLLEEERRKIRGIGVRFKDMDAETLEQVLTLYERLNKQHN